MPNQDSKSRGFTFLELIVVTTVVTFLSTVGIVAYRDYSQRQLLDSASKELSTTIQLAKSRSISQVQPSDCSDAGIELDGYRINIPLLSQPEYTISAICEGGVYDKKTVKLPRNLEFDDSATTIIPGEIQGTGVFFPVITLKVEGTGDIVIKGFNKSAKVSVDSVGTVRIVPL